MSEASEERGRGLFFALAAVATFMVVFTIGLSITALGVTDWQDDGDGATAAATEPESGAGSSADGEAIYTSRCASCHGPQGEGGVGPQLAGTVADTYPDVADQIAIVVDGRNTMPAFGGSLTEAEIEAVVSYERTELGG